jgi:hypothetical protein
MCSLAGVACAAGLFASGLGEVLLSLGLAVQRIVGRGSLGFLRVDHCFVGVFAVGVWTEIVPLGRSELIFGVRGHVISNPPAGGVGR